VIQQQHQEQHGVKHRWNTNGSLCENKQSSKRSHEDLHVVVVVLGIKGLGDFLAIGLLSLYRLIYMGVKAHDSRFDAARLLHSFVPRRRKPVRGGYVTPCSFFSELDVVRRMLDDHLIDTSYYRGLLCFVREQENNRDWQFERNLLHCQTSTAT
jgi:hypothetical protein